MLPLVILLLAIVPMGHAHKGCPFYLRHLVELGVVIKENPGGSERHSPHPFLMENLRDYAKEFGGKNAQIKLLGSGTFAWTYRVIDPETGKSVVVKLYASGSAKMAHFDSEGLRVLQLIGGPASEIRTLKTIEMRKHFLVFEDTDGVPLDNYLKNENIPLSWRDQAQKKYLAYRKRIRENTFQWAIENGYEVSFDKRSAEEFRNTPDDQHLDFVLKKNGEVIDIWIKDDNILVTPGGELVLIDPY